jgi:hypothetical protein
MKRDEEMSVIQRVKELAARQMLSDQEFTDLIKSNKDRLQAGDKKATRRFLLFQATEKPLQQLQFQINLARVSSLLFMFYAPLNFSPKLIALGFAPTVLASTCVSGAIFSMILVGHRRFLSSYVYKIEYDILDERFVITKPSGSFFSLGNPYETMVDINDFK